MILGPAYSACAHATVGQVLGPGGSEAAQHLSLESPPLMEQAPATTGILDCADDVLVLILVRTCVHSVGICLTLY